MGLPGVRRQDQRRHFSSCLLAVQGQKPASPSIAHGGGWGFPFRLPRRISQAADAGSQWPLESPRIAPLSLSPPWAPSTPFGPLVAEPPRPSTPLPSLSCLSRPEAIKAREGPDTIPCQVAPQGQGDVHSHSLHALPAGLTRLLTVKGKEACLYISSLSWYPGPTSGPFLLCYLKFSHRRFPHASCYGFVNKFRPPQNHLPIPNQTEVNKQPFNCGKSIFETGREHRDLARSKNRPSCRAH
jgi:hypothetical protein